MSYRVVAACVLAKNQQGLIRHVYEGGIIDWLSPEQEKHFLDEGLVEKVGGESAPAASADADDVEVQVGEDGKPVRASVKAALVKWLSENQSDYSAEELSAMHKDDLWALIDAK